MLADEYNLDRGKLEIEVDLVAIHAQCEVQIEELKSLTNVIIPLSASNNVAFCWHITQTWTPRDIPLYAMRRSFVSLIMCVFPQLWQRPPHFNHLIIPNQCFLLKVKDMIEIFE